MSFHSASKFLMMFEAERFHIKMYEPFHSFIHSLTDLLTLQIFIEYLLYNSTILGIQMSLNVI